VNFLLDTNVVSEWIKPRPNAGVANWLAQADEDRLFISVITLAELRRGIDRLAAGRRRSRLDEWLRYEFAVRFEQRVVDIDGEVADAWGRIMAVSENGGQSIGLMNAFIAATVEVNGFTLVTRNESHFRFCVNALLNPWTDD
jgi:toxin FitB